MAYDLQLEKRLSSALELFPENIRADFAKKKMFGGVGFLYRGKMTVGIIKEDLVVRVVAEKMQELLNQPHVRPMDFTRTPMKEFVFVSPEGYKTHEELHLWIELGLEHARRKLNL